MKRIWLVFFFVVIFAAFTVPRTVSADDYISEAVKALQQTTVYVAPGIPETDYNTASKLQGMLRSDDNIVLVMLPSEAGTGTDTYSIAKSISEKLDNQRTIGLSVGKEMVGYGPGLPSGVAADQMHRAESVSNGDPVTALRTFVRNMHSWLSSHPQPTPTLKPTLVPTPEPTLSPVQAAQRNGIAWGSLLGMVFLLIIGIIAVRRAQEEASIGRSRFVAPDQVKDLLLKIARERQKINDEELRQILYQMCLDIEKYFKSSSNEKDKDALFFKERLTEVASILVKYIDVQENMRYYNDPEVLLYRGKKSIMDFSTYVLDSIRRGNAANLLDFKVNTNILQAQRFR